MNGLINDLRHGARVLAREPLHTAAAVVALALGIGATSALFSVVDATLLRRLPFPDPDRLVVLWERNLERGLPFMYASPPNYADWGRETGSFEGLAAFATDRHALASEGQASAVQGAEVTASLFPVLGVRPHIGRVFTGEDEVAGSPGVIVLGYDVWQTRFGGDPGVLGRSIEVDGDVVEVIGVMEPGFAFPPNIVENRAATGATDLWLPLRTGPSGGQRGAHFLTVVGRLRSDAPVERATDELVTVADRLAAAYPETNRGWTATIVPLHEQLAGQSRGQLAMLLGSVGLVLLIACVNVANLLLARGAGRAQELAVRAALGARRLRIVRQLLTESAVLGLVGGLVGAGMARVALGGIVGLAPESVLGASGATLDGRAMAFTLAVALASAVVFGTLPALTAASSALSPHLKEGGRADTAGRGKGRLESMLVGAEVALSLTLLVGAGLLFQTFLRLAAVDAGIETDRTIAASVTLPGARYGGGASRIAAYRELGRAIRANPAVEAAGFIYDVPLAADRQGTEITLGDEAAVPEGQNRQVNFSIVTSGYFGAMGIPVVRGRDFDDTDRRDGDPVVLVNQALVDRFLADRDPLVERIGIMGEGRRIVGVVGNVRHESLREEPTPVAYLLYDQQAWSGTMSLVARGASSAPAAAGAVRDEIARFDGSVPLFDVTTVEAILGGAVDRERFSAVLMAVFAALAVVLASVGIFGVVSHAVARRRRETGIRIALGAEPGDVRRLVVRRSMRPVLWGVAAGVPLAFAVAQALRRALYGVGSAHVATYAGVIGVLLGVALLASWLPAVRATRVDPAIALRNE